MLGLLLHVRLPKPLPQIIIYFFAKAYRIRTEEAEKSIWDYPSLGEFFVRGLKDGVRPLAPNWLLHCADSVITQAGEIREGLAIQAKGSMYSIARLCTETGTPEKNFDSGFFLTYYLCPTDYHRVHSPITGEVTHAKYIPGDLWPVNEWSTRSIPSLFCINERIVLRIKSEIGEMILVLVGATNVGHIELAFDASIKANQGQAARDKKYAPPVPLRKGQELGRFRMGSTVILLLDEKMKSKIMQENPEWNISALRDKAVQYGMSFINSK